MKIISSIFLVLALACSGGNDNKSFLSPQELSASGDEGVMLAEPTPPPVSEEVEEQKIIKTARLVFETNELEETHQKILKLTNKYKGLIQNDNSGKDYNRIYKNLTIRIPTENFQSFIDGISSGVDFFDQKEISQKDVAEEFVDLQARLKAKRELENRYLELLKQAKTVEDMLQLERELFNIREEIEARQGRLQFLENRVSMSTVTIDFYKTTAETGITQSYGQKIKNAFRGGWNGISVFFLGIIYLWPLFVFGIIAFLLIRSFLYKKKK